MPEFTAVSSADPSALVNELNAHATNGWEVVSVVESGGRVHAIMRREGAPSAAAAAGASAPSNATVAITHTPAGWYPDPSGRFEMRYWDGLAWTEHVSRQGQQYTDPPTA